jgi:hypothetical protein
MPDETVPNEVDAAHGLSVKPIRFAGTMEILPDGLTISLQKRPRFIHRLFTRLLLGWKWTDSHEEKAQ